MANATQLDGLLNTLAASRFWSLDKHLVIKTEKHHTLLDGLALLFVRNPTQDVAAVCMTRNQLNNEQVVTFWLAMNAGCDLRSRTFAQSIIEVANSAKDGEGRGTCVFRLICEVVSHCVKKINRRRTKLVNRLSELDHDDLHSFSTPLSSSAVEAFNDVIDVTTKPSNETWSVWLRDWFSCSLKFPIKVNEKSIDILHIAYHLAHNPPLLQSLNDQILQRRMEKLGQYVKTVRRIVSLASREKENVRFAFEIVRQFFSYLTIQGIE